MGEVRFCLSAEHDGRTVDLWRLVRSKSRFVVIVCSFPRQHHTYIDGIRPHLTAQDGLAGSTVHPDIVRAVQAQDPSKPAKRIKQGRPVRWNAFEDYEPTSGLLFTYPEDFDRFPPATRRLRNRLTVPLEVRQGVQGHHYLAWPTERTRAHLLELCALPHTVAVWICSTWEPWSVMVVSVTKPGARRAVSVGGAKPSSAG